MKAVWRGIMEFPRVYGSHFRARHGWGADTMRGGLLGPGKHSDCYIVCETAGLPFLRGNVESWRNISGDAHHRPPPGNVPPAAGSESRSKWR
jgi:hypothetical protein